MSSLIWRKRAAGRRTPLGMQREHALLVVTAAVVATMLLVPNPASAGGIRVTQNSVEYSFAQHVTFILQATSENAEISQAHLFFRAATDDTTHSEKVTLDDPGREVRVTYTHDVQRYPLPPFADISFWWQIEDSAGHQLKTPRRSFRYEDNRFVWNQLEEAGIRVHWIADGGDPSFAQTALDIGRTSVADIRTELRGPMPSPLDIFIYDSDANLHGALVLTGRDWVGGQARPELGVVVIAIPAGQGYTLQMKRYIPHEITHLLIHALTTPEGYKNVADWLDEGLATSNEQLPTPEYAVALETAREAGQLLPLEQLCVPFSPDPRTAVLSYAQSASVVDFIREHHGAEGIRRLLSAYAEGASCKSGVEDALNTSFARLEADWRMSLESQPGWLAVVDKAGAWIALSLLGLLLAVPMIGRIGRAPKI